jgi:hypothetical protein
MAEEGSSSDSSSSTGIGAVVAVVIIVLAITVIYLIISGLGDILWNFGTEWIQEMFRLIVVGR